MHPTKKIFIFVVFVILIGFGIYELKQNYESPVVTPPTPIEELPPITGEDVSTKKTFAGSNISFQYSKELQSDTTPIDTYKINVPHPGIVLASVSIPRSIQPGTNFSEAWFAVAANTDAQALKECTTGINMEDTKSQTILINGTQFTKFAFTEGAAGSSYETTSYRTIHSNTCYVLEYTIHSTNLYNYDPGTVRAFDKTSITATLEDMVQSFKFL